MAKKVICRIYSYLSSGKPDRSRSGPISIVAALGFLTAGSLLATMPTDRESHDDVDYSLTVNNVTSQTTTDSQAKGGRSIINSVQSEPTPAASRNSSAVLKTASYDDLRTDGPAPAGATAHGLTSMTSMKLVGIIIGPDHREVLVSLSNGQFLEMAQGESLLGKTIVSIENQKVIVASGSKLDTLQPGSDYVASTGVPSETRLDVNVPFPRQPLQRERGYQFGRTSYRHVTAIPIGVSG